MSDPSMPEIAPSADRDRNLKRAGIGAAIVAAVVVVTGISIRNGTASDLAAVSNDAAAPTVNVIVPDRTQAGGALVLPGNVQAYNSAAIYARTNGYVNRWLADIGDRVGAGQSLAILDAPELDQQLAQADADYQTALANQRLARTTAVRWSGLLKQDAVSQQEADEKAGDLAAKSAVANGELANVKRLRALQGFTRLTAPFAGTVTSRSAQIGALVVAGTAASQPLFTVSDTHRMRIYVRVPQVYSAQIHPGLKASMTLPEFPGRSFPAELVRSAGAVDGQSGTVLIELQADNSDGGLKPGAYAQVSLPIAGVAGAIKLPASALMFRDKTPIVAIVDKGGKVTLRPVAVGRDEGSTIEVLSGIAGNEQIIDSPPDAIATGDVVKAQRAPLAKAPANAKH